MKRFFQAITLAIAIFAISAPESRAVSFALDSIAAWGKFPRFCVDTYRWGDKFFNSYDSTYVVGTGRRFNIKLKTDTWSDMYNFYFDNDERTRMVMMSNPSTSAGFWLTYMAVSVGYDLNIGKYFGGGESRKRFSFQFNCSLFAADAYFTSNDIGTTINRFGPKGATERTDIDFNGIMTKSWGLDTYYFFNHKNYSQAAAFAFSKVQVKSAGSFYAGLSFWGMQYNFDFNSLPAYMKMQLPLAHYGYLYRTEGTNYAFRLGYGYNWVFHPGWTFAVSESPIVGVRRGWVMTPGDIQTSFSMYNRFRTSLVWNHNEWFIGGIFRLQTALVYDKAHTMLASTLNFEVSAGYRFNLW